MAATDRTMSGSALKALDTFSHFQRPVLPLGVSQHVHKIPNL